MSPLTERIADLRRQLDHLSELRPRVDGPADLRGDLSLHNDVLFGLLRVTQAVVDIAGRLAARRGLPYQDYTEAVRALAQFEEFPPELVERLVAIPGFRNVLVHEYVDLDYGRVIEALDDLQSLERFARIAAEVEAKTEEGTE